MIIIKGNIMKVSQLQPGHKINEHLDGGKVVSYEVVSIAQVGRMFEVTFRSVTGLASALYQANACVPAVA
jgi:hypothetical protein